MSVEHSNHDAILSVFKEVIAETIKSARSATKSPSKRREAAVVIPSKTLKSLKGYRMIRPMPKDPQDLSKVLDVEAEERLLTALPFHLKKIGIKEFIVLSEERGVLIYPEDSQYNGTGLIYLILIDPIDSTDLALMSFGGAVAVTAAFMSDGKAEIVTAVVGDLTRNEIFWAVKGQDGAFVDYGNDKQTEKLQPNSSVPWEKIKLSSFSAKINRFEAFCSKKQLIQQLDKNEARVVLHHGGPLPVCRVAAGDIDAVVEFDKGYKAIDYSGALFLADKAGAKVKFYGENQPCDASHLVIGNGDTFKEKLLNTLIRRQRFICAANEVVLSYCKQFFSL